LPSCSDLDGSQTAERRSSSNTPGARIATPEVGRFRMLYSLAVILLIAWLLGVVGTYAIGGYVHALLIVALLLFLIGLLSGDRTVA
jgi:hypothetical protein